VKIISIVGARPNFMKIAPFIRAISVYNQKKPQAPIKHTLVHTGQHYDERMSDSFFKALNIPEPDINLGVGSGSHAEQVGYTMIAIEKVIKDHKPDWLVVVGDVNAILAGSVTAKKEHVNLCHIEAGLRSGDITMPEEVNRLVADRLSDLLLTPDRISNENLRKEGVPNSKIKFVGNIMIDTLEDNRGKAANLNIHDIIKENVLDAENVSLSCLGNIVDEQYALMTMHRPSNVDEEKILKPIMRFLLDEVTREFPLIWPIHPRTQKQLREFRLWDEIINHKNMILLHPIGYHDMLRLNMGAKIMLTDSGGLQEESTVLGTPCLTLRWNTERPVTLREHGGASVLVGNNIDRIKKEYRKTLAMDRKPERPELWDGKTAERCLEAIINYY
jgi:UDP-N-acetylglucosamine 2-epimerase (non-hydrolysing)